LVCVGIRVQADARGDGGDDGAVKLKMLLKIGLDGGGASSRKVLNRQKICFAAELSCCSKHLYENNESLELVFNGKKYVPKLLS
jgi:hypothetical protein